MLEEFILIIMLEGYDRYPATTTAKFESKIACTTAKQQIENSTLNGTKVYAVCSKVYIRNK